MNDPSPAEHELNRRHFIGASMAVTTGSLITRAKTGLAAAPSPRDENPICVFTKPFNSLSFDELADRIAELGFDGIEAPIRKGGHVEPEQVADELPALVEALNKRDLEITVLTSDVNDPDDPLTERVLRTAATLGIQRYRMKYYKYDLKKSVLAQIEQWRPKLKQLAAMNHDFGLTGIYQNHAGTNYLGAPLWDLQLALRGIDSGDIGVAYDIRHATAEGGMLSSTIWFTDSTEIVFSSFFFSSSSSFLSSGLSSTRTSFFESIFDFLLIDLSVSIIKFNVDAISVPLTSGKVFLTFL